MSRLKDEDQAAAGKPTVISVQDDLHQRLKILAARRKTTLKGLVEAWLWERLKEEERKKTAP